MELVWLPLMSGSVSLDNVEEVGGVPTSGAGSDGCIAPRAQSGCEAQPDEGTVEVVAEPSVVTPANISQASTGVAEVGSSRRLSAADKGMKAVVEESKMESSDSDENEQERGERRSRNAIRRLRREAKTASGPERGIHIGDGGERRVVAVPSGGVRRNTDDVRLATRTERRGVVPAVVDNIAGDTGNIDRILQEITDMQNAGQVAGATIENTGHKGITGTQYPGVDVKHDDDATGRAVVGTEVSTAVDIDTECARQLQNELYQEYLIKEASREKSRQMSMSTPSMVVYVIDSDSNDDGALGEWSDPEHDWLVEIDRRLRDQEARDEDVAKNYKEDEERKAKEQEERDAEVARRCAEELEQAALAQVEKDNQVARICQAIYEQNATEEQIENACARAVVGEAVDNVAHNAREGARTPGTCLCRCLEKT
ncbi:hypothetical protein ACQJBY_017101 [Aegilops geniculata]